MFSCSGRRRTPDSELRQTAAASAKRGGIVRGAVISCRHHGAAVLRGVRTTPRPQLKPWCVGQTKTRFSTPMGPVEGE